MISQTESIAPAPGFSARFQANLELRRKKKQQSQIRRTILVLGGAIMTLGLVIFGSSLVTGSFVKSLGTLIGIAANIPVQIGEFRYIVTFWTTNLPEAVQIVLSFAVASWVFLLLIPWILTFVRFNRQGAQVK